MLKTRYYLNPLIEKTSTLNQYKYNTGLEEGFIV